MKWQCMWDTSPQQASMLLNPEDGYKYSQCSAVKVQWKCPNCGHVKIQAISNVKNRGLSCPICSDGISIPNRFMAALLDELDEEYDPEHIIQGRKYRYDFYIPHFKLIIEMHGRQHYEEWGKGDKSLYEIQVNDKIKKEYALSQKIDEYIEINCKLQDYKSLIKSVQQSRLSCYYDLYNIDWASVCRKAMTSKITQAVEMYKNGIKTSKIAKILKVSREMPNNWLIEADKIGLCNYIKSQGNKILERQVILTNTGEVFPSISSAGEKLGQKGNYKNIQRVCARKGKFSGYINGEPAVWRYLDEYDPNEQIRYDLLKINGGRGTAVSKYNQNKEYICTYATKGEALKELGYINGHSDVFNRALKDSSKMAYGYYWYRADDVNQPDKTKIFTA